MQKETMTIHFALCEKKTLEKRIDKTIHELELVSVKEQCAKLVNGRTVKEFTDRAKKSEQKARDLINRLNALSCAINQYNASHTINVAGKDYTIAEAIWLMQYGLIHKKNLLEKYEKELSYAISSISQANGEKLETAAARAADAAYGGKEHADGKEYLDTIEQYKERHQCIMVDPLSIRERIESLRDEIEAFETQVDAKIQASNAMTEITIEY